MIKKYQKDPDTSDEENEEEEPTQAEEMDMEPAENTKLTEKKSVKVVKKGRPKESKTKDPEELYLTSEQIEKYILDKYAPKYLAGKIPVSDVKKMQPTRVKPPVSDEKKQALIEQLKRGRETIQKNKILRKEQQIKEVEELKKKSIIVPNPVYVRKQKKKQPPAPAPKNIEPNLYPETEEESETTDTREIRKTKEKIKMIQATTKPTINYSQLSILEKLRSKF